jgi:hypothetical protein
MTNIHKQPFRRQVLGAVALTALLGLAFWLYTQPELVVMLSDQLWACF